MRPPRQHPPFFPTLFELSFRRFIAPRLIPIAYVLGLIAVLGYALAGASAIVSGGGGMGGAGTGPWIAAVIVFLLMFVVGAIFVRIQLEVVAVAFRIYERVADLSEGPVD